MKTLQPDPLPFSPCIFVTMKRLSFILLIAFCSAQVIYGQDTDTPSTPPQKERRDTRPLKERIWFGGGIGLSFGTATSIQLDPMVGYKVDLKGKFTTGVGISYWYSNYAGSPSPFTAYGYRPFVRYRIIPQLYTHGEFLHMNREIYNEPYEPGTRLWVPHLLIGGGYVQSLGGRSSIFIQALFEVLQDPNSLYYGRGPIFGGGIGIGF